VKYFRPATLAALGLYSVGFLLFEYASFHGVPPTDVSHLPNPFPLYVVNATLSVFLMLGTALLFMVSLVVDELRAERRALSTGGKFYISQIVIFALLGLDEQFRPYDALRAWVNIEQSIVLLVVGAAECVLIARLGEMRARGTQVRRNLYLAAAIFVAIVGTAFGIPERVQQYFALAGLAMTWFALFSFLVAWEILREELAALRSSRRPAP